MRPEKLLELLACPGTDNRVSLVVTATSLGVPYSGWLVDSHQEPVAELREFKFDFCHFDRNKAQEDLSKKNILKILRYMMV